MKKSNKILSAILCVVMLFTMGLTNVVFADIDDIMFDLKSLGSWIYYLLEKEKIIFI